MPEFSGIDLNDDKVEFPDVSIGKKSLIGFAFSRKSQEALQSWAEPVYYEFIDKESLASLVYDVNVYLVIVFNGTSSNFKGKVTSELKENVLIEFFQNIVLSDADEDFIRTALSIEDRDVPTLFTLDANGKITDTDSGFFTQKKLDKLSAHLEIE